MATDTRERLQMQKKDYNNKKGRNFHKLLPRFEDDEGVNVTPLCFNYIKIIFDS